jgi:glycosyltransferase involved in cell wall biosynthesis
MPTVTYLVTVYNKQRYILGVINALKATTGIFQKEFIFINDGSSDDSLDIIKQATQVLTNVKIVNQANRGPSISTNIGIKLAQGDYIHFVDGDDLISIDSTSKLLEAANSLGCDFAFSAHGTYDVDNLAQNNQVQDRLGVLFIQDPLKELARGKIAQIRSCSGALVKTKTLLQANGCNEAVFVQDFSLKLRCAKLTKFARVNKILYYCPRVYDKSNLSFDKGFERRQSLLAIYYFLKESQDLAKSHLQDFYKAFWSIKWKTRKSCLNFARYITSKIIFQDLEINDLTALYAQELKYYQKLTLKDY